METSEAGLIELGEAQDPQRAGMKAAELARALADGYRVPEGLVLPVAAVRAMNGHGPQDGLLRGVLERLGGVVAVRSSAVDEDRADASFAGQYESFLGIDSDAGLRDAVARCVASAGSEAVTRYREKFDGDSGDIAVLIQRMLRPSAAGVAFSVDPVTGQEHVVVQAAAGVGEAVLSGEETGERWTVGDGCRRQGATSVLQEAQVAEVAALCRELAARSAAPVDIEWAFEDGALHLLQVRPITAVPLEPRERPPEGMTFVREPRFDGPINPLSFSTWLPRHSAIFQGVFERFGLPVETIDNRHLLGRVYGRVKPLMDPGKDGQAPPPALIMKLMMTLAPPMRRRLRNALEYDGERAIRALIDDWEQRGRADTHARTRALRAVELAALADADLAQHLDAVLEHVERVGTDHFMLTVGAGMIPTGRLGMFVEDRLGWPDHQVITLVQGYGHASVEHGKAVAALAQALGPAGVAAAIEDPSTLLQAPAARAYLEQHGHRINVDLSVPTEAEDPRQIADHLRRHRDGGASDRDPKALAHEREQQARAALANEADRERFDRALELARLGRPHGDETELTTLDALTLVRRVALEAGRRFAEAGRLEAAGDVFFLEQAELSRMLRSPAEAAPEALPRRRLEHRWALANPAPEVLGPDPVEPPPVAAIPGKYRSTVGAVFWALGAHDPAPPANHDGAEDTLRGIPGSPGRATGTVRVVRSPQDFGKVEAGDIVVCPITVAAWSPIFGSIAGLVTERGGPLSHPATLAREYGLPAVLAVTNATTLLQDGTRITIDGGAGTVTPA